MNVKKHLMTIGAIIVILFVVTLFVTFLNMISGWLFIPFAIGFLYWIVYDLISDYLTIYEDCDSSCKCKED